MTVEQQALALVNEATGRDYCHLGEVSSQMAIKALKLGVERHEAFRQEVSGAAVRISGLCDWLANAEQKACSSGPLPPISISEAKEALSRFITAPPVAQVPEGQTPLEKDLTHRLLDVIREGSVARDSGASSPYHGHSLEHCLHATGWVQRDLRIALDKAQGKPEQPPVDPVTEAVAEALDFDTEAARQHIAALAKHGLAIRKEA